MVGAGIRGDKVIETTMPIRIIRISDISGDKENLPLLRINPTYLLNLRIYNYILSEFKKSNIDTYRIEELGELRKGQEKRGGERAYGIMPKSIAKLSVHPLKLKLKCVSKSSLVKPGTIVIISTGIGSIGRSGIVPQYLIDRINSDTEGFFGEKLPVAVTQHVIKFELKQENELPYYIVALLNSFYGRLLIEGIATYGATGQLEVHIPTLSKLRIPIIHSHREIATKVKEAIEHYEAEAWKAYFEAMKIVEEYFGKIRTSITSVVKLGCVRGVPHFRIDPPMLLANVVLGLIKERSRRTCRITDLFEVYTAGVPREKKYKVREGEYPLVTIDSIDESGIVDDEKVYYIKREGEPYRRGSILLVKDGTGSVGKVSILPYNAYVMQGIATLVPKPSIDESLVYYVLALLKLPLYRKIIEALGYGATGQYSVTKDELESLEIPIGEEIVSEVSRHMKEFIEKMNEAIKQKGEAILDVENYIRKLIS